MGGAVRTILVASVMLLGLSLSSPASARQADPAPAASSPAVEDLVAEHRTNQRLQTERPDWEPEAPDFEPRERNPFFEAIADFFAWLFSTLGPLLKYLLIAAVAAIILYALWYMFGDVAGLQFRRRREKPDGAEVSDLRDQHPDQKQAVALLDEADRLAAEGRFAEAVHLLLFRSIEDVRARRAGGVPPSLTAREIQSLSDLSQRARDALGPIIRIVESSFFGARPVDRDEWRRARASYEDFAFGGAPA